jgi:hypothetical protein
MGRRALQVKLTPARRKALDVMRREHPRWVRISNVTMYGGSVYWQTARWLEDHGLARIPTDEVGNTFGEHLELTPVGLEFSHTIASPARGGLG